MSFSIFLSYRIFLNFKIYLKIGKPRDIRSFCFSRDFVFEFLSFFFSIQFHFAGGTAENEASIVLLFQSLLTLLVPEVVKDLVVALFALHCLIDEVEFHLRFFSAYALAIICLNFDHKQISASC